MENFPNKMRVCITESGKLSGTKLGCLYPLVKDKSKVESIKLTFLKTGFIDEVLNIAKINEDTFEVSYLDNMIYSVDGTKYFKGIK